jgi:hypothetical protein
MLIHIHKPFQERKAYCFMLIHLQYSAKFNNSLVFLAQEQMNFQQLIRRFNVPVHFSACYK